MTNLNVICFAAMAAACAFCGASSQSAYAAEKQAAAPAAVNRDSSGINALLSVPANLARWMYPFNANPGARSTASVFGSLGSSPSFDSRDAQFLLGWDLADRIPAGQGTTNYLVRRVRLTLTISTGGQYAYSGLPRDYRTYFPASDPRKLEPSSTTFPVELFGVGFRGGYSAATYPQDGPWGVDPNGGYHQNRVAYAAGFDLHGRLADVSNNVADDGTNEIAGAFETAPFAIGQSSDVAAGELMPADSRLVFDLNLEDPLIRGYVLDALNSGHLRFMVTSFAVSSFGGPPKYPSFHTIFSAVAAPDQFPLLDMDVTLIRPEVDADHDGLPDDWEYACFDSLSQKAADDLDGDGTSNLAEFRAGTNPANGGDRAQLQGIHLRSGEVELRFSVAPGRSNIIEWSEDLIHWQAQDASSIEYSSSWLSKESERPVYPSPVYGVWRDKNPSGVLRFYRTAIRP